MLEIKLSKNMTITSDGKFNYILTKDEKPIGFYNSWNRLHVAMNRGNKKLTKKDLEKVNSISSLMSNSIDTVRNECKKFKKLEEINFDIFDYTVKGINYKEVCICKKGTDTITYSLGTVQSALEKILELRLMNGEDLKKSTKEIIKNL